MIYSVFATQLLSNISDVGDCAANPIQSITPIKPKKMLRTNLQEAILEGADLRGADFRDADLREARVLNEKLLEAYSLRGTTMPD